MPKLIDRTGNVHGRLTVVHRLECGPASNGRRTKWVCKCECGNEKIVTGHELTSKDTASCGCLRSEMITQRKSTHRMTRTPTYRSWQAAKDRCYNEKNEAYAKYGLVGIRMCERWISSFEAFLEDMKKRPYGMTLDRINPEGHYEPSNCRWATYLDQAKNKRKKFFWKGKQTTIKDLAHLLNVPRTSLNKLICKGLPVETAAVHAVANRKKLTRPHARARA